LPQADTGTPTSREQQADSSSRVALLRGGSGPKAPITVLAQRRTARPPT